MRLSVFIKIGDVGTGKCAIVATRTEDDPSPIRTPGVVAIDVRAVGGLERIDLLREEVFYIEVG